MIHFENRENEAKNEYLEYKIGILFELNRPGIDFFMKITLLPNSTMMAQMEGPGGQEEICEYLLQSMCFLFWK